MQTQLYSHHDGHADFPLCLKEANHAHLLCILEKFTPRLSLCA